MATLTFAYNHARDPMNPEDLADKIQQTLFLLTPPQVDINPTQIIVTDAAITSANTAAIQAIINAYTLTAEFGFSRVWTPVLKIADEPRINSVVLAPDASLQMSVLAGAKYAIRGLVFFDTTAAGDFKYGLAAPAPSLFRCERAHCIAGGTPAELILDTVLPTNIALVGTGILGGYIRFELILHNGGSAGRFQFQFAQNTQTNDTGAIVRAGSYLEYARVA